MVLAVRQSSFPQNRRTQRVGLAGSDTPSRSQEKRMPSHWVSSLLPCLSKIPQGYTPTTKQIPALWELAATRPSSQLKPSAMSLPLLHLPCCLSCPSDNPEPQTVLSAWNILRSQDQGPCYKHSPLHNPWGSWYTPKWCEVVSKNLKKYRDWSPSIRTGIHIRTTTNHEGPCFLVEPGGRWLRSSHLCHPKLKRLPRVQQHFTKQLCFLPPGGHFWNFL